MGKTVRAALLGGSLALVAIGGPAASGAEPELRIEPDPATIGGTITVTGHLTCPGMPVGDAVLIGIRHDTLDHLHSAGLGSAPLRADDTFELVTTVPTTMYDLALRQDVPTEPGEHRVTAHCSSSPGEPNQVATTLTVRSTPTTTTTTSTTTTTPATTTTTTTPASTTTTTTAAPTTTTPQRPAFLPPAEPPTTAEAFDHRPQGPVPAGSTLDLDEGGFTPGEDVHVVLYSTPTVLARVAADASGTVRATVTIPADTPVGAHVLALYGTTTTKAMAFDVTAAPTTGAPGPDPAAPQAPPAPATSGAPGTGSGSTASPTELPRTGAGGTAALAALGVGLLAAGAATLRFRDRRPATSR